VRRLTRTQTAFIIAPLWVPLLVTPYFALYMVSEGGRLSWGIIAGGLSALLAYLGTYLLGRPLFNFLISRNWTTLWLAVVSGCCIGIITRITFMVCFAVFFGESVLSGVAMAFGPELAPAALLGALVGGTLWLIARPDFPRSH